MAPDRNSKDEANKRRQRNRLSQRSFRERRLAYINELEEKSRRAAQTESERNKTLQSENVELRNVYLNLRKKVLGVICTLQEISEEAGKRLNLNLNDQLGRSDHSESDFGAFVPQDVQSEREDLFPVADQHITNGNEGVTESSIQSLSYTGEMSDNLSNEERTMGNFGNSNAQWTSHNNLNTESTTAEIVLNNDTGSNTEPNISSTADPVYPSQSAPTRDETYSADNRVPENIGVNSKARSQDSVCSNGDYFGRSFGNDASNQFTVIQQRQTSAVQVPQTNHYLCGSVQAANIWSAPSLPRSIQPTSPLAAGIFQQRPGGSLFLEHVDILEALIHQKYLEMENNGTEARTSEVISTAVTLFHDYAWEGTARFWARSQARSILEAILAWRCTPSNSTLTRLPTAWRPTPLQLYSPHSCIIDWFPHPGLRDALILHYNNSDILDQLFWDCMDCWVVTVEDIATVLTDVEHGPGLIGVWNIVEAMEGSQPSTWPNIAAMSPLELWENSASQPASTYFNNRDSSQNRVSESQETPLPRQAGGWTPMPLELILNRKDLARDLFYHLNMYDTISNWLFDACLFEKYPELKYPGFESLVAKGKPFRIPARRVGPTKLSSWTINLYRTAILGKNNGQPDISS